MTIYPQSTCNNLKIITLRDRKPCGRKQYYTCARIINNLPDKKRKFPSHNFQCSIVFPVNRFITTIIIILNYKYTYIFYN